MLMSSYIALTNLVLKLGSLAYDEYVKIDSVGYQLKSLENELRFMREFLRNSHRQHELVSDELVMQIREVSFEAEDIIEGAILYIEMQKRKTIYGKVVCSPLYAIELHVVDNLVQAIKTIISEIHANKEKYIIKAGESSCCRDPNLEATLKRRREEVDKDLVGFKDVKITLLNQLTSGSNKREIISIVGMGGLGKTTIAKSLYNSPTVNIYFKNRAWVSVSADYDTRQVILTILKEMKYKAFNLENLNEQDLKKALQSHLQKNKYLIFLDDVWQSEMWDEVEDCFPDKKNGSRILITTRYTPVGRKASKASPSHALCILRSLNETESWDLFKKEVFRGKSCPRKYESLGMKIVEKCKGLPLAILVIARMLAGQELSTVIWNRTFIDVSVPLAEDKVCLAILALSYRYLPLNLRPCFLYFAVFPEDREISVRRLIALWLAEGFIEPSGILPLEQVAESYLDQLIDRNLVQAGKRRTTDDGLKTCRIHDLVRELCINEAKRENFLWIASRIKGSTCSINNIKPRRLSIQQQGTTPLSNWDPSSVRSFINFNLHFNSLACCKTLSSSEYKLLRVLDLGESHGIQSDDFSNLVNLRYLRLFLSSKSSIPESLFELWNLQMLFLEGGISYNIPLRSLLKLQHLQQLVIGKGGKGHKFSGYGKTLVSRKQLHSLQVLSTTYPSRDFENAVKDGLCPNIKKLALCCVEGGWSLQTYLAFLNDLQVLKISSSNSNFRQDIFRGVRDFNLPKNLTKITLKSSTWSDASMNMLGKFPELTTLKLVNLSYANLIAPEGSFLKLNTLHLDTIRGGEVRFCKTNTELQHLYVKNCTCDFDKYIFLLPGLEDVNIVSPNAHLELLIQKLKQEKRIRCRMQMH